jgi:restriction system protein
VGAVGGGGGAALGALLLLGAGVAGLGLLDDLRRTHPLLVAALELAGAAVLAAAVVRARARRRLRVVTLGDLLALTTTQFEEAVGELLRASGYRRVRRTGGAGDLTADLTGLDPEGKSVVVQCKRRAQGARIGSPVLQTFIGMMTVHHRAERGLFVTTAGYTRPAAALAARHGVTLLDGEALTRHLLAVRERADGPERAIAPSAAARLSDAG